MDDFALADEALIGRVIAGKFCLRRCVGSGASGTVYQADQLALGRTVAIKILRAELTRDARFVARFHDEALAASRLNHPNTVSVIDYGQTEDGLLYLVMEFLRGPTLTHVLRNEGLRPTRIADLVAQILAGLEEAHDAGVIHADLKSDNIVVERRRGDWDLVKVVDFGIARLIGREVRSTEKTICGTPEYMAPEVIQGEDPTYASDLYAVGIVLYELLTGVTPFTGGSSMDVLRRHLTDNPVPPSLRRPDLRIDPILEESAMRALSKHPGRRFESATEFRIAMTRVIGHRAEPGAAMGPCSACGTSSPLSFRFCPDCGHPRQLASAAVIMLDEFTLGKAVTAFSVVTPGSEEVTEAASQARAIPEFRAADDTAAVETGTVSDMARVGFALPLVGRGAELERLIDFVRGRSADNALQVVGPYGSGRSRLIDEALRRVAGEGSELRVVIARPDPTGLGRPFFPLRGAVQQVLGLGQNDRHHQLGQSLEAIGMSPRDVPALAELLGQEGPLWQLEPTVRRREILASLTRLFSAAAERRPMVAVWEDIDRYDHPSQEAVRRVVEGTRGQGELRLLLSNEPESAERWPATLARVELGPLDMAALERLASAVRQAGLGEDTPAAEQLASESGGYPGHVQQLIRYVIEGGSASSAPAGIADLIAARIDHLPQAAKVPCQAAATLGLDARSRHVRALMDDPDEVQLRQALSILVSRGLVTEMGEGRELQFTSSLVRDVVYSATPAHVRRDLHERAARALYDEGAAPAVLGHHYELSGNLGEAAAFLSQAGDDAVHELDDVGARRLYHRALSAARQLMLSDDDPHKQAQFVAIAVKLAEQLRVAGELGLARGLIDEVRGHCHDSRALHAQILRAAAHLHGAEGDHASATGALREAIGLAIVTGQRDLLCDLYVDMATAHLRDAQISAASAELAEGVDLITAGEGGTIAEGPTNLWRLLYRLAQVSALEGQRERAVEIGEQALRHAARVGARVGVARIQSMLAGQLAELGHLERADELRRKAIDEMRRLGDRRATAELLLDGARPTRNFSPISSASLREAQELSQEVGWSEGARRARQVLPAGESVE